MTLDVQTFEPNTYSKLSYRSNNRKSSRSLFQTFSIDFSPAKRRFNLTKIIGTISINGGGAAFETFCFKLPFKPSSYTTHKKIKHLSMPFLK